MEIIQISSILLNGEPWVRHKMKEEERFMVYITRGVQLFRYPGATEPRSQEVNRGNFTAASIWICKRRKRMLKVKYSLNVCILRPVWIKEKVDVSPHSPRNHESRSSAERSQRWNAFSVNIGSALTLTSTEKTAGNKSRARKEIKVNGDRKSHQRVQISDRFQQRQAAISLKIWSGVFVSGHKIRFRAPNMRTWLMLLQYRIANVV